MVTELQTYEVVLDASKLVAYKIPIGRVFEAIERNNANAGGGYIVHAQEQYLIRGEGRDRPPGRAAHALPARSRTAPQGGRLRRAAA